MDSDSWKESCLQPNIVLLPLPTKDTRKALLIKDVLWVIVSWRQAERWKTWKEKASRKQQTLKPASVTWPLGRGKRKNLWAKLKLQNVRAKEEINCTQQVIETGLGMFSVRLHQLFQFSCLTLTTCRSGILIKPHRSKVVIWFSLGVYGLFSPWILHHSELEIHKQ